MSIPRIYILLWETLIYSETPVPGVAVHIVNILALLNSVVGEGDQFSWLGQSQIQQKIEVEVCRVVPGNSQSHCRHITFILLTWWDVWNSAEGRTGWRATQSCRGCRWPRCQGFLANHNPVMKIDERLMSTNCSQQSQRNTNTYKWMCSPTIALQSPVPFDILDFTLFWNNEFVNQNSWSTSVYVT